MSTLIHDLYHGKLSPADSFNPDKDEYFTLTRQIGEAETRLLGRLEGEPELKQALVDLLEAIERQGPMEAEALFSQGFRMGARMMLEVLEGK